MSSILDKLEAIKARFDDLGVALTNPEVVNDNKRFSQISREYRKLEKIVEVYKTIKISKRIFGRQQSNTIPTGAFY